MSYQSPIELFHTEPIVERIVDEYNQYIYKAVTDLNIKVDKKELEKALAYDRDQYWKGFSDGRSYTPPNQTNADRIRAMTDEELAEWIAGVLNLTGGSLAMATEAWLDWLKEGEKE